MGIRRLDRRHGTRERYLVARPETKSYTYWRDVGVLDERSPYRGRGSSGSTSIRSIQHSHGNTIRCELWQCTDKCRYILTSQASNGTWLNILAELRLWSKHSNTIYRHSLSCFLLRLSSGLRHACQPCNHDCTRQQLVLFRTGVDAVGKACRWTRPI